MITKFMEFEQEGKLVKGSEFISNVLIFHYY